jgi:hypothetical protein
VIIPFCKLPTIPKTCPIPVQFGTTINTQKFGQVVAGVELFPAGVATDRAALFNGILIVGELLLNVPLATGGPFQLKAFFILNACPFDRPEDERLTLTSVGLLAA